MQSGTQSCGRAAGSARGRARSQIFRGMEPVFLRRSVWTASGLPVFVGQGFDLGMSECDNAMAECSSRRLIILTSLWRVFQALPRVLVSSQVILLSLLLAGTMGVRCAVVQFSGLLVVLIMRSVVVTGGHLRCSRSV